MVTTSPLSFAGIMGTATKSNGQTMAINLPEKDAHLTVYGEEGSLSLTKAPSYLANFKDITAEKLSNDTFDKIEFTKVDAESSVCLAGDSKNITIKELLDKATLSLIGNSECKIDQAGKSEGKPSSVSISQQGRSKTIIDFLNKFSTLTLSDKTSSTVGVAQDYSSINQERSSSTKIDTLDGHLVLKNGAASSVEHGGKTSSTLVRNDAQAEIIDSQGFVDVKAGTKYVDDFDNKSTHLETTRSVKENAHAQIGRE